MVHPHLPYYGSQFLRFAFVTSDMLFGCVVFVVQLFTVALFLHSGIKVNASNAIDNSSSISTSWKGVSNRYSLPTFLLRQLLLVQTRFLFTPVCVRLFVMLGGYFSPKVEFVDFSHETFSENTLLLKLLFPVICLPMLLAISFVCILATIRPEPGFRKAPSTRMHNRFDFFYILLRMVAIGCLTFAAREISIIVIPIVCAAYLYCS
ncbi:hypothetical protein BC829DRAFT_269327 [Chytridium lagenaria]|nr:hypothetical protein BC829DRAFT_269327 [Chytridium lagenaria]